MDIDGDGCTERRARRSEGDAMAFCRRNGLIESKVGGTKLFEELVGCSGECESDVIVTGAVPRLETAVVSSGSSADSRVEEAASFVVKWTTGIAILLSQLSRLVDMRDT